MMSSLTTRFVAAVWVLLCAASGGIVSAFVPQQAWRTSSTRQYASHRATTITTTTTRGNERSSNTMRLFGVSHRDALVMMPATIIEREAIKVGGTGPSVVERQRQRTDDPVRERHRQGNEAWEVRIYNDGLNTREHVARSLVQVTGMSEMTAYQTMMQAHQNGIAVVGRWPYEVAEMYHDALKKNGIICDLVPVDEES
mmetsp:Transcript_13963/g.30543  ORF Transcript_13963/g.30543 Transcript_13963/m.30543 type:complete len:198 (-) Transcript_13963:449-1042(-)|eukprot:CAMPEP_0168783158 /NCGR_PEP_ID=MMETSP0725-20121227/9537_1 /TAXON_ID=265536 /ORGANISM="Amphiprora sp., Strain CCMP467" /LENGTH=197 /DNA_ID=CAMNT_0008833117 /DNA_START=296 /DNA_END=889 /DNA_ORIENTATION=-